jgi:hypothetical protein
MAGRSGVIYGIDAGILRGCQPGGASAAWADGKRTADPVRLHGGDMGGGKARGMRRWRRLKAWARS